MRIRGSIILLLAGITFITSCRRDDCEDEDTYNPTPYELNIPKGMPDMIIPADNPLTVEGIALGRKLFYEKKLSADNTMSCGSCHIQSKNFTDGLAVSKGVDDIAGTRSSMSLINVGYAFDFFWDGRAATLEDQALGPVPNPIELHITWPDASQKLQDDAGYPDLFFAAFGTRTIDSLLVVKAIAQFERTLISSGNTKFNKWYNEEGVNLTPQELDGFDIFTTERGDCFHCHTVGGLFTDNIYHNNGLDEMPQDSGRAAFTKSSFDFGKFKTPTLLNIEVSGPYMHDGRFATLGEVVDHYNLGGEENSPNIDPLMKHVGFGLNLTFQEKENLIAFMKTLTDEDFLNNPEFSDPN